MKKIFSNRNHFIYFTLLMLACIWLAALHWVVNPYKLAVWIYSSDSGYITIESRCEGQGAISKKNSQSVVAGYIQYELSLPKCRLSSIEISSVNQHENHYEVSSAAITYYGKEIHRLFGSKRTLEGDGPWRDSRPGRAGGMVLATPLVLPVSDFSASMAKISWPRYLPLLLLPLIWWISKVLAACKPLDPEQTGASRNFSLLAAIALALIVAMAAIAKTDVSVNPDELTHVASARYYYDHWLKPKIGSPDTLDAHRTNVYGVAYLTGTDPVYQLASKFAITVWPVFENDVKALRMFNVALFGLLAFLTFVSSSVRLALIPLLVTPQAWYVFSYFNGDGLPLFLSVAAFALFAAIAGMDKQRQGGFSRQGMSVLAGVLVGLILLSKPNYWPVIGVLALLIVARAAYLSSLNFTLAIVGWFLVLFGAFFLLDAASGLPSIVRVMPLLIGFGLLIWAGRALIAKVAQAFTKGELPLRLFACVLIGLSIVIGVKLVDETWRNPPPFSAERSAAMIAVTEDTAVPEYKPSALRNEALAKGYRLRDQGAGVVELLLSKKWIASSSESFIGVYGYLNIKPPPYFANTMLLMLLVLAITVFVVTERSGVGTPYAIAWSIMAGIATVFSASVGFSWIVDYQAQGRYLLAILPIMGGGLAFAGQYAASNKTLHVIVLSSFLLSAVSFIFIGMQQIPK